MTSSPPTTPSDPPAFVWDYSAPQQRHVAEEASGNRSELLPIEPYLDFIEEFIRSGPEPQPRVFYDAVFTLPDLESDGQEAPVG
jgi:hypothetical protein